VTVNDAVTTPSAYISTGNVKYAATGRRARPSAKKKLMSYVKRRNWYELRLQALSQTHYLFIYIVDFTHSAFHTKFNAPVKHIQIDKKVRIERQYFIKARHARFVGNVLWQHCL
jgi:hypothetical protein